MIETQTKTTKVTSSKMTTRKMQQLMYLSLLCILASTQLSHTLAAQLDQSPAKLEQNPCMNKATCHECIQTQNCGWCMKADYGDRPRCFLNTPKPEICPEEFIYNPDTSESIRINKALTWDSSGAATMSGSSQQISGGSYESSASRQSSSSGSYSASGSSSSYGSSSSSGSSSGFSANLGSQSAFAAAAAGEIVQIKPQRVSLKLRINEVHNLDVSYSQAVDYPVDLYYLMDLSKSMEDDKEKLSALGDKLSETMKGITSNFRLGFGSFVDKVLMPYVSTIPKKLEHPCDNCKAPYGYRNHMPLSNNTESFSTEVKQAAVSGNLDAPEGGFDAIMQAIACRQQVGWREQARRLLVFSTDAGFHYAGDGKLGGVITPNDGECHLNAEGMYTHSIIQDYPSISQINQKVKQNAINIIFAVTQNQYSVYQKLSGHIEGSSSAILSNDSSNVVDLVREEYSKISSTVEMKDNATGDVKITYYSSCLSNGPLTKTNKCSGLKVGDKVTFTANITVTKCPTDPKLWKQVIQIYPVGINESMIIDLEMLCSCPCEHPGSIGYEKHSTSCSKSGILMCGICECDDLHFGNTCECSMSDVHLNNGNNNMCRQGNNTNAADCNGRGSCVCGACECKKRSNPEEIISGKYCECENFSCERNKNLLCSGPDHGICECNRCVCKPGWTGSSCDCQTSKDTCMPPNGGEICSGHGTCECGVCKCKSTDDGRYSGKYCDKCPTCSGRCHELKDCVQCQMYHTGELKNGDDCAKNCTTFTPVGVEKVKIDEDKDEQLCVFFDEDDCKFTFKYSEVGELVVHAQEEKECPPKVFMLGIVLGVIAAIVLVGLAILLLWKLLTTIHDRREFARFEKERMNAKWDTGENPIYKQATSTFKNPIYAGK
ncbi:integrin beta-PS isoform X2 [Drosophila sulfurigaster albostrigata]|uniref:integrin beta-PS isoform X2 n=1 Tax=Drosophila sulfurigaster albostrigata TaxID=89887 RepID=UPI002D219036|nr:integrin beta-PS isoform X2 [Drosophila sulfurigaster albostrigata]XP_062141729.1 integrin beta-PS isoform X2 [Drosophila sulfurigaster albostrigata]